MLQLTAGSNGGQMIERSARGGTKGIFKLPIPLQRNRNCNFSYSGLKTSFRYAVEKMGDPKDFSNQVMSDVCATFQSAAFRHVKDRVGHALTFVGYKQIPVTSLVVVGGVACNEELRRYTTAICYFIFF